MDKIKLYDSEKCIVSELAREIIDNSYALEEYSLVLPNKRLEVSIAATVSRQRMGSYFFDTYSFDELIVDLLENHYNDYEFLQSVNETSLFEGDLEEMLLADLISKYDFDFINPSHAHELSVLHNSLVFNNLMDGWCDGLEEVLAQDQARSEVSLDMIRKRVEEVSSLFDAYAEKLKSQNAMSQALKTSCLVARLEELISRHGLSNPKRYILFGFTTLQPIYRGLFEKITESSNVFVRFPKAPNIYSKLNPIRDMLSLLQGNNQLDDLMIGSTKRSTIVRCNNVLDEVYTAISIVKSQLQSGISPSEVAILVSDESSYGPVLKQLLREESFDYNFALPKNMNQTFYGRFFVNISDFINGNQNIDDLYQLLQNKDLVKYLNGYSGGELDINSFVADCYGWISKYDLTKSIHTGDIADIRIQQVVDLLKRAFHGLLVDDSSGTLNFITDANIVLPAVKEVSSSLLESLSAGIKEKDILQSVKLASNSIFDTLGSFIDLSHETNYSADFMGIFIERLGSTQVRGVGYPLKGVQVTSVIEARFVPFNTAIVLGCSEGSFPKSIPNDVVIDSYLKSRAGIPGWNYVESMEDTTFTLLWKRVENTYLLYPEEKDGNLSVPSRFIDRVLVENPETNVVDGQSYSVGELSMDLIASNEEEGKFQFQAKDYFGKLSPTSIEKFIKCPYQYLLSKLGLRDRSVLEEQILLLQGLWIHEVIEVFLVGSEDLKAIISPLDTSRDSSLGDWQARMGVVCDQLFDSNKIDYPSFYQIRYDALPKLVEWLYFLKQNANKEIGIKSEYNVSKLGVSYPNQKGIDISLNGTLDGLFVLDDLSLFLDFKTSRAPSSKDLMKGIAPQLLLYAYVLTQSNTSKVHPISECVLAYWKVMGSELDISAIGQNISGLKNAVGKNAVRKPSIEDALANTIKVTDKRFDEIFNSKRFKADPGDHCQYCGFKGICRKNDPLEKDRIENNASLQNIIDSL